MHIGTLATCLVVVLATGTPQAHAYLDPGTGSMLIQGAIAAIAAAGVIGRLYWHRLLVLLGVRRTQVEDAAEEPQAAHRRDDD